MRALSILRRIEAQLYTYEVEIKTHGTEMAAHDVGGTYQVEGARRHTELREAVFALEGLLTQNP